MPPHTVIDAVPEAKAGPATTRGEASHPRWSRAWAAPLWAHGAALGLVLLALLPLLSGRGLFSADEGALIAQARQLHDEGTWVVPHPFPEVDPTGAAFPYDLSQPTEDGGAPFVKHTVYPLLATPLFGLGGVEALRLLSILGAVAAALAGAGVAGFVRPGLGRATLWVVGLGSPLLFDSYLLIAHTLGAAAVTAALLVGLRAVGEQRARWALLVPVLVLVAGLLRNEAILYGLALAAAFGVHALRRRERAALLVAAGAGAGAIAAKVADGLLTQAVVSAARPIGVPAGTSDGVVGLIGGRVEAFLTTVLAPSYGGRPLGALLVLLVGGLLVGAALAARRPVVDVGLVTVLGGAAALCAALRLLIAPIGLIPGLLAAFPLLLVGLCLLHREQLRGTAALVAGTGGTFVLAVLATQYTTGGSGEWGGRYFAVALPTLVPLALAGLAATGSRFPREVTTRVAVALLVVTACLAASGVASLRAVVDGTDAIVAQVASVAESTDAGDGGPPVVLTTGNALARLSWEHVPEGRWLLVDEAAVGEYAARLRDAGVDRLVFVGDDPGDTEAVVEGSYRVVSTADAVDGARWRVQVLAAS